MELNLSQYQISRPSRLRQARLIGSLLLRAVKSRLAVGRKRTKEGVDKAYNLKAWKSLYDARSWEKAPTLRDLLTPAVQQGDVFIALMEGRLWRVPHPQYYDYRLRKLHRLVDKFASPVGVKTELVEVGCGWGMNLFSLKEAGFAAPMRGYDISQYGVATAREIDAHFQCGIQFAQSDLIQDDISAADSVILTYYCLEQLKYHTEAVLNRICSWAPARVIHIEPVIELYKWGSVRDVASRAYISLQDYQNKLLTALQAMEQRGQITILYAERQGYSANALHEGSCIVWEPRL